MIQGIERLCDAYITLAYMDASRHKNEKSEQLERSMLHNVNFDKQQSRFIVKIPVCVCPCFFTEAIPIPADQPIMQIKDLDEVVIPTMEVKVWI